MSANISGLTGLVPAVAALGLVIQSLRSRRERRRSPDAVPEKATLPVPVEPWAARTPAGAPASGPAGHCRSCGTEIPRREELCAICERKSQADPGQIGTTLRHWAVFLAMMIAIMALGYVFAP
jgi:hypothetical protein